MEASAISAICPTINSCIARLASLSAVSPTSAPSFLQQIPNTLRRAPNSKAP